VIKADKAIGCLKNKGPYFRGILDVNDDPFNEEDNCRTRNDGVY
jgi:hypothetical protein